MKSLKKLVASLRSPENQTPQNGGKGKSKPEATKKRFRRSEQGKNQPKKAQKKPPKKKAKKNSKHPAPKYNPGHEFGNRQKKASIIRKLSKRFDYGLCL